MIFQHNAVSIKKNKKSADVILSSAFYFGALQVNIVLTSKLFFSSSLEMLRNF